MNTASEHSAPVRAESISGIVTDEKGRPLANVVIYALNYNGLNTRSDADGRFVLGGLRPGDYDLLLIHKQFKPLKQFKRFKRFKPVKTIKRFESIKQRITERCYY